MSVPSDRHQPQVSEYGPEVWPLSSSSAAAAAVCYEPGCVLSMTSNAADQFRPGDGGAPSTSTSVWFSRPSIGGDVALFRGSREVVDRHFYEPRPATMPTASVHPLSTSVQPPQPTGTCCNFSHTYDRFTTSNNCEYFDLQPFQHGYPWLPSAAGDGCVGMAPFGQCVGLAGCPSSGAYGPSGLEVPPYTSSAWVHVKSERRSSSSATSASFDGPPTVGCAAKIVPTSSPTCRDGRQLKREMFVTGSVECSSYDEFSISADVNKDDWTTGRCHSDASPSSVEQLSDVVCHPFCTLHCH